MASSSSLSLSTAAPTTATTTARIRNRSSEHEHRRNEDKAQSENHVKPSFDHGSNHVGAKETKGGGLIWRELGECCWNVVCLCCRQACSCCGCCCDRCWRWWSSCGRRGRRRGGCVWLAFVLATAVGLGCVLRIHSRVVKQTRKAFGDPRRWQQDAAPRMPSFKDCRKNSTAIAAIATSPRVERPLRPVDLYPVDLFDVHNRSLADPDEREQSRETRLLGMLPPERCVTVRMAPKLRRLLRSANNKGGSTSDVLGGRPLQMGLEFVENVEVYAGRKRGETSKAPSFYHFFHFVEFLLVAFSELTRLDQSAQSHNAADQTLDPVAAARADAMAGLISRSGADFVLDGPVSVPWIYTPHLSRDEITGRQCINCEVAQVVLNGCVMDRRDNGLHKSTRCRRQTAFFGLEANDPTVQRLQWTYRRSMAHEGGIDRDGQLTHAMQTIPVLPTSARPPTNVRVANQRQMTRTADAVMLINRDRCPGGWFFITMWHGFLDAFPVDAWHARVSQALAMEDNTYDPGPAHGMPVNNKVVVTYVNRQSGVRVMPWSDHEWIMKTFGAHPNVEFRPVRMEWYSPTDQVRIAYETDLMIGVHGNGLTHLVWMKPRIGAVIEIFHHAQFLYYFSMAARLMKLSHLAVFNGHCMDHELIDSITPTLRHKSIRVDRKNPGSFSPATKRNILAFVENTFRRKVGLEPIPQS